MPFVENMDDENKDQTGATQGPISPTGGGGAVHLAPSAAVAPTGGNNPSQGGASPNTAGGQFASLDKYITANQGQAEPLAGQITGNVNKQYDTLVGQNTSTLNDIGSQVSSNAIPNANDLIAKEAANPVSFTSDSSNIPAFQKLLTASYSGPASAESTNQYQTQQAAINNAIATGNSATTTEAGREGLLQQTEAIPTAGVTALDSAILSQSPTALSSVEKAYDPFANLLTNLSGGAASIDTNIGKTQSDLAAANAQANKQIASQTSGFTTDINNALNTAQQNVNAYNAGVNQYDTNRNAQQPFAAALESSGLLPQFNIADPYTQTYSPITTPTANTIATPDQLNLQQALAALGGNPGTIISPNLPVGGYTTPGAIPVAPDVGAILTQIGQAEAPLVGSNGGLSPTMDPHELLTLEAYLSNPSSPFYNLMNQVQSIYGNKYVG